MSTPEEAETVKTIEIDEENNNIAVTNDFNDNTLNNENKEEEQNIDIDDNELLTIASNHHRENDVSTNKIIPIINELNNNDNNNNDNNNNDNNNNDNNNNDNNDKIKPQINNNDEKVSNTIQKQRVLKIEHGHCSKQGIRPTMEDQVVVESPFLVYGSKCTSGNLSIYGVFDGHGGRQCAEYCATNLCETLTKYLLSETTVDSAFNLCISELDERTIEYSKDASGSTCCIILIDNIKYDLFCCNVGDSRSILINKNCTKHKQLSIEHKPEYPIEKQRIENANGWVTFGRVCGILAVSRSLGDKDFKYEIENLIISKPDITHHKLILDEDKYIILACDGLYDVFTNEQCTEWINNNNNNNNMQQITDKICHDAIHVRKSKDNVSVLILRIDYNDIEIEIIPNANEQNDFEGTENNNMNNNMNNNINNDNDDIKDNDKIYNSTSSNGSVGSPNN
eukprot:806184_1